MEASAMNNFEIQSIHRIINLMERQVVVLEKISEKLDTLVENSKKSPNRYSTYIESNQSDLHL
jgi:division protein CdvB (Snf7/Vps24/ESCRT-III family)